MCNALGLGAADLGDNVALQERPIRRRSHQHLKRTVNTGNMCVLTEKMHRTFEKTHRLRPPTQGAGVSTQAHARGQ